MIYYINESMQINDYAQNILNDIDLIYRDYIKESNYINESSNKGIIDKIISIFKRIKEFFSTILNKIREKIGKSNRNKKNSIISKILPEIKDKSLTVKIYQTNQLQSIYNITAELTKSLNRVNFEDRDFDNKMKYLENLKINDKLEEIKDILDTKSEITKSTDELFDIIKNNDRIFDKIATECNKLKSISNEAEKDVKWLEGQKDNDSGIDVDNDFLTFVRDYSECCIKVGNTMLNVVYTIDTDIDRLQLEVVKAGKAYIRGWYDKYFEYDKFKIGDNN